MSSVGAYALVSLEEAKEVLNITDNSAEKDRLIERLIDRTTSLLESYCDRKFKARDYTNEEYDGDGTDYLLLDNYPVNSVDSLYDDTTRVFNSSSLVDEDNYVIYSEEGKIGVVSITGSPGFYAQFSEGKRNIRITYNAGYSSMPDDLKMIALEILIKKFQTYDSRRVGILSVGVHGDALTINLGDILPEHREILDRKYRR